MSPRPFRVLVSESDPASGDALADAIRGSAELELAAVATSSSESRGVAASGDIDVALIALEIDGAAELARALRDHSRVVGLATSARRTDVVAMLRAGAVGYLTREATADEIVAALVAAGEGLVTISPAAMPAVVEELVDHLHAQERVLDAERERLALVRRVLDQELVEVVFQPIVSVEERKVRGYEALARIPLEPVRPPDQWFAEAWRVGLGSDLEVLAVRVALRYLDQIPAPAYLAVNVSPDVVAAGQLRHLVHSRHTERLVVEMTEHAAVHDYDMLALELAPLREVGTRVSVDDTGAGFASLRHILRLEPDYIKLDGSITRRIDTDIARHALARGLVGFANEIDAHIVGEGVETESELETLRRLGVSSAQGFLLGRPGPLPART